MKRIERQRSEAEESSHVDSYLNHYFDHIYVVNLKFEIKNRLIVAKHLNRYGINFEVFEATNGYEGEAFKKYQEYQKRELGDLKRYPEYSEQEKQWGHAYIDSAGVMGYIYTYLRILGDAKKSGYKRFLILEDDILLSENFENLFKNFILRVDKDWKILLLGASQYGWDSININTAIEKGYYFPINYAIDAYTYGSFAIAFDSTIVDKLIEAESAFEAPFDHLPMGELYERYLGKCFVAYPNIVMPDVADSTIRGKKSQYTEAIEGKWPIENFDYPLSKPSIAIVISSKNNLKDYYKFSHTKELPFNLRLFFNSSDGLHPLHTAELLNAVNNIILPLGDLTFIPESDYLVTIGEDEILEENDIIKFIEYKVGILEENTTPLKEIGTDQRDIKKSRVSVIIPLYQKPKNLKDTLTSVMMQDYHDIEVIIVFEKEIDKIIIEDTRQLISSLNSLNSNCHIVSIEHSINRNLATARNTGIMNSSGEYICFLDNNDVYLQGRLSKSIEKLMQTSKTTAAVYCGYTDCNSIENHSIYYKEGDLTVEILLHAFEKHYLHANTVTYRRDAILNINGFDESYYHFQDSEFHLRYFEHYTIGNVQECLVQFGSDLSMVNDKIVNSSMMESKRKFLNQFWYIAKSIIETQMVLTVRHKEKLAHLKKQSDWIKKQEKVIEEKTAHSQNQSDWIKKQEKVIEEKTDELQQLKAALQALSAVRFSHHPIKKIKNFKKLMVIYRKLKS